MERISFKEATVPPSEKKTTLVKMLAKLIVTLPRPSV